MKACVGLRASMNDIGFFFAVLFLSCWYFALNQKVEAVITVYSEYAENERLPHIAVLLPPMFSSLVYCTLISMIECCAGWKTATREGLAKAQQRAMKQKTDRASAARLKARARLGRESEANDDDAPVRGQSMQMEGLPTAMSAIVVMVLGVAEATCGLYPFFMWVTWKKAIIAGLILKWALLNVCLFLVENMMPNCTCSLSLPFQHWVRSHRMARDMIVSLVVVLPQLPLVLLVALNEHLCPGCGAHQLLIYRDPGAVERQEKVFEVSNQDGEVSLTVAPPVASVGATGSEGASTWGWAGMFNFGPKAQEAPPAQTMPAPTASGAPAAASPPPAQSV